MIPFTSTTIRLPCFVASRQRQRRWRSPEGDDDETEKRFSETTFGNFNEQWKEFKDAPCDILQLDHDCVEEQDQKNKKSEEEDSDDDEMDNNVAIAAKTAGLLEGLFSSSSWQRRKCVCGARTLQSGVNIETSYDTERHAVNPSKVLTYEREGPH